MKTERALKIRNEMLSRIRDAYSVARLCHLTSQELNAKIQDAMRAPPRTPEWVFAYVRGYRHALGDALYKDSLVFGGYVDGAFYSTHRNRADYYETNGIAPADYADNGRVKNRGHYWSDNPSKPFFIG